MISLTFKHAKKGKLGLNSSKQWFWTSIFSLVFVLNICACKNTNTSATSTASNKHSTNSVPISKNKKKVILFFGNSLTAGYGLSPEEGFAGLIQKRIDSLALDYTTINAGLSGETTSGGNERIDWLLDNTKMDIFVLELGANDALRGLPVEDAEKNLQSIITKVKSKYPSVKIVLAGMFAPPNMGKAYEQAFKAIYPRLQEKNNISLIPFLLEGVAGMPQLNLADGIHPNVKGHQIVRENVWKVLKEVL